VAGFQHEALFYRDEDEFVALVGGFVREGLERDEAVVVVEPRARLDVLRESLGGDAGAVCWLDMGEVGANPGRIIPLWADLLAEQAGAGRTLRGVGEPAYPGRRPAELVECEVHETLLDHAFAAGAPWRLLCPYDRRLPSAVRDGALRTHARWRDADGGGPSPAYRTLPRDGDLATLPSCAPLPAPTDVVLRGEFGQRDVPAVRRTVRQYARFSGLGPEQVENLELAASELTSNCICHGGGSGSVAMWREPDAVVVEFSCPGRLTDPLAGRRRPDPAGEGGMGLYLVQQLCDLVQTRTGPGGTTTRVSTWVPPEPGPAGHRPAA
jgi:anti-sigma regulatory factor (Ser/Thr protein kinase)